MRVYLVSTWSKRYEGKLPFSTPWPLATHQWGVYQALHDPDIDVVFDTAITGDGKSLAAFLPVLRPAKLRLGNGLFAYPTNELIRDQMRQAATYQDVFGIKLNIQELNGESINRYAQQVDIDSRYTAILDLISRRHLLLTNPDVFNLIEGFAYIKPWQNPATLAQQLANRFRFVVFDEFHIFGAPQIATVLDTMLFIRANQSNEHPTKYLFLSATPHTSLEQALKRAGFRYSILQGEYEHGVSDKKGYRQILQDVTLDIVPSEANGIMGWCKENFQSIRAFYQENPGSKGAIICNSVFTAKRLVTLLRETLEPEISIGENTGLSGQDARKQSFNTDLIVATSTVDVGVDFRINFLVFESLDAGTFIQRLGRLGRHQGFSAYRAVALLPQFITERFAQVYQNNQEIDRLSLFQSIREQLFPEHRQFEEYIPRWGGVKASQRLFKLCAPQVRTTYQTLVERYQPSAVRVFGITSRTQARTQDLMNHKAVHHELGAFRGAGLLDVWIYDPVSQAVGTMSILRLIAGTEFALLPESEAKAIAEDKKQPFYKPVLGLYARISGYQDEWLRYALRFNESISDNITPLFQAVERTGFYLESLHNQIRQVNMNLERLPLCTWVGKAGEDVQTLRRRYALPPFFELHPVLDATNRIYPIAFGQDALLLDSISH